MEILAVDPAAQLAGGRRIRVDRRGQDGRRDAGVEDGKDSSFRTANWVYSTYKGRVAGCRKRGCAFPVNCGAYLSERRLGCELECFESDLSRLELLPGWNGERSVKLRASRAQPAASR